MTPPRAAAILALIVAISAGSASAQVGVEIAGLSWHPSSSELEGFNPGLGARYLFLRRASWRADVFGGGYRNSNRDLCLASAVGVQRRVLGPVHAGVHVFALAHGHELERIYAAPLPTVTIEAGPLDLNLLYIPRLVGVTGQSAAFGFHITVWPFGGRGLVSEETVDTTEGRVGLEFGVTSGPGLTHLTGRTLSARWLVNERFGWRAGLNISAESTSYTWRWEELDTGESSTTRSSSSNGSVSLQIQHVRVLADSGGSRLLGSLGPRFYHEYGDGGNLWLPGVVFGLGAEFDVVSGLSLLGEYTTSVVWRFLDGPTPGRDIRSCETWTEARLGVVLWW